MIIFLNACISFFINYIFIDKTSFSLYLRKVRITFELVAQRLFFDSFRSLFDFVNSKVFFFLSQIGFAQILSFYKSGKGYLKTKALLLRGLIDIRQLFLKIYGPYNMVNHIYYSCSKLIILKHLLTTNASSPVNHFSHFGKNGHSNIGIDSVPKSLNSHTGGVRYRLHF